MPTVISLPDNELADSDQTEPKLELKPVDKVSLVQQAEFSES